MKRAVPVLVALLLLVASASAAVAARPTGFGPSLPRTSIDHRDAPPKPQIHVVYVVPSDGVDRSLDTNGALTNSVAAFQRWLAIQTGGEALQFDTFRRSLDITFLRLESTDAEIASNGPFVREALEAALDAAGLDDPDKIYAAYYDGTSTFSCGGGAWPPLITGNVAAMYLHGLPEAPVTCDSVSFAPAGGDPTYLEFGMLHEIMHTLGFVPDCAPNEWRNGHVSDTADDLMWGGDTPWAPNGWGGVVLDAGHDDYFQTDILGCLDFADSAYLQRWR